MVSYHGYMIWCHKEQVSIHFWVKMHVYSTFFNNIIKVKLVDEMMQSNYLWVIFHVKCKKLLILTVFTLFLNLDKIQDGGQDGDHVWWRQRPPAAPPPIKYTKEEDPRLSTQGKIVSKNCNISNTQRGGGGRLHQPPPLVPWWGYEFSCTSGGQ